MGQRSRPPGQIRNQHLFPMGLSEEGDKVIDGTTKNRMQLRSTTHGV